MPTPPPTTAIQFTTTGGKWGPKSPFGMVGCCNTPSRDGSLAWILAEPNEADAYLSAGGTLAVFRTGPTSDQSGGWGLIQSPPGTESRLRRACKTANAKGLACLVEAGTDCWALKQGNSEYQLYGDSCSITHDAPPARYQRWTREVVHQVGDLKVLWSLGNECWLCDPSRAWQDGIVFQIRQAEKDFGYPAHPIGNVYQAGQVGNILYDFVEVHGTPEEFCNQPDVGVPVIWTESSNERPPESNQRMLSAKTCADQSGGKKAALLWRGGIDDAQWDSLFKSLGGHAPVRGSRQDTVCLWNKYEQSYGGMVSTEMDEATYQRLATAVEQVIAGGYSWLFTNNGNNLKSDGTINDEYQRIDYFSLLAAYLTPGCTIVGNPDAPNSYYEVDNIELQIAVNPCAQSGQYLTSHPIIFGQHPNWNQVQRGAQLKEYPAVFKGRTQWSVVSPCTGPTPAPQKSCGALGGTHCYNTGAACPSGMTNLGTSYVSGVVECNPCCKAGPTPSPTPTPAPTPTPTPTPAPGACPVTRADVTEYRNQVKPHAGQQINVDPVACGPKLVAHLNNCGTKCCPLAEEKGNAECERALLGDMTYCQMRVDGTCDPNVRDDVGVKLVEVYPGNTFIQKVASGAGTLRVCGQKDPRSCEVVAVEAAIPPCEIYAPPPGVSGQGCVIPSTRKLPPGRKLPKPRPGFGVRPR